MEHQTPATEPSQILKKLRPQSAMFRVPGSESQLQGLDFRVQEGFGLRVLGWGWRKHKPQWLLCHGLDSRPVFLPGFPQ